MGSKKVNIYRLINSGSMAATSTITSSTQNITNFDNVGLQIIWSGTPTGTIEVQCSVDEVNFYPLTFSPAITQPSGSAGGYLIDLNQVPFPFLRVQYVNASGAGVLDVYISSKDVN